MSHLHTGSLKPPLPPAIPIGSRDGCFVTVQLDVVRKGPNLLPVDLNSKGANAPKLWLEVSFNFATTASEEPTKTSAAKEMKNRLYRVLKDGLNKVLLLDCSQSRANVVVKHAVS